MFYALRNLKKALKNLNPSDVRADTEKPIRIALVSESPQGLWRMESFLTPRYSNLCEWVTPSNPRGGFDLEIWDSNLKVPSDAFAFDAEHPDRTIEQILDKRFDIALPLARNFPPFRHPVIDRIVRSVAKENATFSAATALPDILPLLTLPWAVGEFASDTAFLTMNQIRMAFLIAAASGNRVGYGNQKAVIGSVVASAFGLRAIARELVAKIPFGGGIIPKAGIAWTATWAMGRSMERLYTKDQTVTVTGVPKEKELPPARSLAR